MSCLRITLPGNDHKFCESIESLATDISEAIALGYETFRILHQLGPLGQERYLEEVRKHGPDTSFVVHRCEDPTSQTNSSFHGELFQERHTVTDNDRSVLNENLQRLDCTMTDNITLSGPLLDTIDPTLLVAPRTDWDIMMCDDTYRSDNNFPAPVGINQTMLSDIGGSDSFISSNDNMPGAPNEVPLYNSTNFIADAEGDQLSMNPSQVGLLESCSDDTTPLTQNIGSPLPDPCEVGNVVLGLPTPPSDSPTPSGTSSKAKDPLGENILHELRDPDVQDAIERGEGLVMDNLSTYLEQNSLSWQQKGFWFEESLDFTASDCPTMDRPGQIFRRIYERRSAQKLSLRVSQALLYLSCEILTRGTQRERECDTKNRRKRNTQNTHQKKAATLSVDNLLKRSYPEWDMMDIAIKHKLREKFHDYKRQGSRFWRAAGVLGLGAILACGDTLAKVIKNHKKYSLAKLDVVINYVACAHPAVLSIYHGLDELMKQILRDETISMSPAGQDLSNKIRCVATTFLAPQQVNQTWCPCDPTKESERLIEDFIDCLQ